MKTKLLCLATLLTLAVIDVNAQWTATNVSAKYNANIEDMCEHNGHLFASISDSGLVKLDNNTNQWSKVHNSLPPTSNNAHITRLVSSGNYLYAFVKSQATVSTIIYKSEDDGVTFVVDSVGHPRYGPYPPTVAGYTVEVNNAYVLNDKVFAVMNKGLYSKYPNDPEWIKEANPDVLYAKLFADYNNTLYVWASDKLYTSTDTGATWIPASNTGIPVGMGANLMNVNPTSGRIYVGGAYNANDRYSLIYSDNEGASWDSLAISQYLGINWIGSIQEMYGLISKGDNLTAMLTNDANDSHPDVITSTDGGQTFSVDTVGLQPGAFATVLVSRMLYFNGELYLAPNYNDIYKQGGGVTSLNQNSKLNGKVYPNPVNQTLNVQYEYPITSVQVTNTLGELVKSEYPYGNTHLINFNDFPNGVYFVRINSNNKTEVIKILKE